MIQKFNYALTHVCDTILSPLDRISPLLGILVLSLLSAIIALLGYKLLSNPQRIKQTKEHIKAQILALRLYRDFWQGLFVSFFKSLIFTGRYFVLNLFPLLFLAPVLFLLFVQMDIRYGMRPFRPKETFVLKAKFLTDIDDINAVVKAAANYRSIMNPVYIKALREIDWKLQAEEQGDAELEIFLNDCRVRKSLFVGDAVRALSNHKFAASSAANFIYPAEALLAPCSGLQSVSLNYPSRKINFIGLRTHWLVYYLALVLVIALSLRRRFGVEF